ncbi:S-layer homology domain-containing protein [Paenibacillus thiaminolyticus]|nr:S-layer homology domain-containing protein [Paenibacillus thiaminolyticus]
MHPPQRHHLYIRKKHIVEGYPDGTFKPDHTISREEMTRSVQDPCSTP